MRLSAATGSMDTSREYGRRAGGPSPVPPSFPQPCPARSFAADGCVPPAHEAGPPVGGSTGGPVLQCGAGISTGAGPAPGPDRSAR
ncbi:hypothetical protein GCM10010331_55880 [Streptomyces xanthochromogenes]|nr:hypothetical protein GCM10010331_55880 [Streptomyces xanthochromogenes]